MDFLRIDLHRRASDLEDGGRPDALNTMPSQRTRRTPPNWRIYFERSRRAERVFCSKNSVSLRASLSSLKKHRSENARSPARARADAPSLPFGFSPRLPARSAHSPGRAELDAVRGGRCAEDKVSIPNSFGELTAVHRSFSPPARSIDASRGHSNHDKTVRSPIPFLSSTGCFACPRISRLRAPLSDDTPPPIFAAAKRAIRVRCGPRRRRAMRWQPSTWHARIGGPHVFPGRVPFFARRDAIPFKFFSR
jgi:hypothetical protein